VLHMTQRRKPQTIEYAFRFAKGTRSERTRMVEMIRVNLEELVKLVSLMSDGQEVQVNGFCLRDNPKVIYRLDEPVPLEKERPT
jgi:hypothetical protein